MSKHPKGLVHKLGAGFSKALSDSPTCFGRVAGDNPRPEFSHIVRSDARSAPPGSGSSRPEKFLSKGGKYTPIRKPLGDGICMARHSSHPKINSPPILIWAGENSGMAEHQELPEVQGAGSQLFLIKEAGEALWATELRASRRIKKHLSTNAAKLFSPILIWTGDNLRMANDINCPRDAFLKVRPFGSGNPNPWSPGKRPSPFQWTLSVAKPRDAGAIAGSTETAVTGARADTLYIVCGMPHLVALLPPKWAFGNGPNLFLRIAKIFLRPFSFASGSVWA